MEVFHTEDHCLKKVEALEELRKAVMKKADIEIDERAIKISERIRIDRSMPTAFRSIRGRGDPYTVEAIFFQFKYQELKYLEYVRKCMHENIPHVQLIDKKNLLAYLTGDMGSCANITGPKSRTEGREGEKHRENHANTKSNREDQRGISKTPINNIYEPTIYIEKRRQHRDQSSLDSVTMNWNRDFSRLATKLSNHLEALKKDM